MPFSNNQTNGKLCMKNKNSFWVTFLRTDNPIIKWTVITILAALWHLLLLLFFALGVDDYEPCPKCEREAYRKTSFHTANYRQYRQEVEKGDKNEKKSQCLYKRVYCIGTMKPNSLPRKNRIGNDATVNA